MDPVKNDEIRQIVRENYGKIAKAESSCCGSVSSSSGCCDTHETPTAEAISVAIGYSAAELASVPEGANLGLGCGNPQAIAELNSGETVLDLGSGAGFDCFLAANAVGDSGTVIGVDMTPDMISKARANARRNGYSNVEFRLGEIENLPVADAAVDVIISNCVINLSPEKAQVFREAFRVLKPGGRLAISDIVLTNDLPDDIKNDMGLYCSCVSGAEKIEQIEGYLQAAGFAEIRIEGKDETKQVINDWAPGKRLEDYILSASITARRPHSER